MSDLEILSSNIFINNVLIFLFSFSFYMQFALVMYVIAAKSLSKREGMNVVIYVALSIVSILTCGVVYNGMAVIKAVIIRTA